MATGALDVNGIWQYGEDDSETTFSALLNRLGSSTSTQMAKALYSGRVIQTVGFTLGGANQVSTTSTSFIDTGLTATITPRFSTSKILVLVQTTGESTGTEYDVFSIFRGATNLGHSVWGITTLRHLGGAVNGSANMSYLDSPITTSATTYKARFRSYGGGNVYAQPNNTVASITLMEIAA